MPEIAEGALIFLKFLPIYLRRAAHFPTELTVEIGEVAETGIICDFRYTPRRAAQRFTGGPEADLYQVFDGAKTEGLLETAHKMTFAEVRERCQLFNCDRVGGVLLDVGEHGPQIFCKCRCSGVIGAEGRGRSEQIEEAEQFTF